MADTKLSALATQNGVVSTDKIYIATSAGPTSKAATNITIASGASVSGSNTGDQTLPVKATGAEIDTGTDDAKFATPKALADSTKFALASKFIAGAGALTGPASPLTIGTAAASAVGDFASSSSFIAGAGALTGPASPLTIGTIASQASNNVSITGGAISGITDLAVADGGTGASTATAAMLALTASDLTEGTLFRLPPGDLTDGQAVGITVTGTAGETVAVGSLVYFKAADSKWWLWDANLSATYDKMVGISLTAGSGAINVLKWGKVRANAQFPTMTIGQDVYGSETAGAVTSTAPTTADSATRIIGQAVTADTLYFCPSPNIVIHV